MGEEAERLKARVQEARELVAIFSATYGTARANQHGPV
jgi:hypothetical protein